MPQLDFPPSVPGAVYVAPNGITYTYDTSIGTGVWKATTSSPLSVTSGSISGTASVGSTLTYTPGTASGGTSPYTYTYQWKANGTVIGGATGLTYVVAAGNAGQSITVTITATDAALPTPATASATTAPTVITTALTVTAGSISGTPTVGSTLTYTPGVASGGTSPYTYTYLWKAGGGAAAGAGSTTVSYVPAAGDIGKTLTVTITATDSASQTANATTSPTAAVAASTIPPATYSPSPSTGPAASNTISTGIWNGTADTLSSTGCIEFAVTTGAPVPATVYGQGATAVANGQTVSMRWKTGGSCTGAADGTAITGGLAATSGGSNTYNFTVDTTPTNFSFTDLTSQALSTAVTSASVTLAGPNVTTYLTTTAGTLTTIQAAIGGGAFAAIPASGTTMPVEPGQTIQIRGTTGASTSTGYTAILGLGGATTTWTATTTAAVATITTPSITSPANGTGNLKPTITLVGSTYAALNGAGSPQTSSIWEVYKANGIQPETSAITAASTSTTGAWTASYISGSGFVYTTAQLVQELFVNGTAGINLTLGSTANCEVHLWPTNPLAIPANTKFAYGNGGGAPPGQPANITTTIGTTSVGAQTLSGGLPQWNVPGVITAFNGLVVSSGNPIKLTFQASDVFRPYIATLLTTTGAFIQDSAGTPIGTTYPTNTLTFATNAGLTDMQVGDTVTQVGGGATGTIAAINSSTAPYTLTISGGSGTWNNGATVKDTSRTTTPGAPTTEPPNATNYTAITGSPFTVSTSPFTSKALPSTSLTTSSTYYGRVQYATTNTTATTSSFSGWSSFGTASTFDVSSWTPTSPAVNFSWSAYDPDQGLSVAVGASGAVWTSTDGISWTSKTPIAGAGAVPSITFGKVGTTPTWVTLDQGSAKIYTSTNNGNSWTNTQTMPTGVNYSGTPIWNPNTSKFMVSAQFGQSVYTSSDGVTWAAGGAPGSPITNNTQIVYIGTTWFITDRNRYIYKSTNNGTTWTDVTPPTINQPATSASGILAVGTTLYAFLYRVSGVTSSFKSTDNGATWTSTTDPGMGQQFYGVPQYNGYVIFVAGVAGAKQSIDGGTTWTNGGGSTYVSVGNASTAGLFGSQFLAGFAEDPSGINLSS